MNEWNYRVELYHDEIAEAARCLYAHGVPPELILDAFDPGQVYEYVTEPERNDSPLVDTWALILTAEMLADEAANEADEAYPLCTHDVGGQPCPFANDAHAFTVTTPDDQTITVTPAELKHDSTIGWSILAAIAALPKEGVDA